MTTIKDLPVAKISNSYHIESKFSDLIIKICVDPLELPLKTTDIILVHLNKIHYQSSVGLFMKNESIPHCSRNPDKSYNFYIPVRRGGKDYKLSVKDFRLGLLKLKGVLK